MAFLAGNSHVRKVPRQFWKPPSWSKSSPEVQPLRCIFSARTSAAIYLVHLTSIRSTLNAFNKCPMWRSRLLLTSWLENLRMLIISRDSPVATKPLGKQGRWHQASLMTFQERCASCPSVRFTVANSCSSPSTSGIVDTFAQISILLLLFCNTSSQGTSVDMPSKREDGWAFYHFSRSRPRP